MIVRHADGKTAAKQPRDKMELEQKQIDGVIVVRCLAERLDALVALKFKDGIHSMATGPGKRIVLDMSEIKFLDSSGLGAIVAVYKLLGPDWGLDLAGLTDAVARVFKLTRMDSVFRIFSDVQTALSADHHQPHEAKLAGA